MSPEDFWRPIGEVAGRLRCWSRLAATDGDSSWETDWGTLLTVPTPGYLEPSGGPIPFRFVRWVEIATMRIKGGLAGRPREPIDVSAELSAGLRALPVVWVFRETTWSVRGLFEAEPVRAAHIPNPFGPGR